MLKLRYLFENTDLAEMLLKNWEYDASSLDLFRYFRISANAIYPFRRDGEICLLRFCPTAEKTRRNLEAELEFIQYLRNARYPALEALPAKTGQPLIERATPWGTYYASVFKRVPGEPISELGYADPLVYEYGAALGRLHRLSSQYSQPKTRRWAHTDVLNWVEATLSDLAIEGAPLEEVRLLREFFLGLPQDEHTYGLIHYDFEPDNVFYEETSKTCSVIDFDDAMYHWYMMDVERALDSLKDETSPIEYGHKQDVFLRGYMSHFAIDVELLEAMPVFKRFANLYRFARVNRAIQEEWEHEPEWLIELRTKLRGCLAGDSEHFGKPLASRAGGT